MFAEAKTEAWSGRFAAPMDALLTDYQQCLDIDIRLAEVDIAGSLAHAEMLARIGVLSAQDLADIQQGMASIREEIEARVFPWSVDREDVHMNIEHRLTQLIGDAGKRLHTARSRNDQVATDLRLYTRHELDALCDELKELVSVALDLARTHAATLMPGCTHLQIAQPVTFGHHLMAYVEMFLRDIQRVRQARERLNELPLGAAALAGTSFPIDRPFVAERLGFAGVCQNSLDAVSDRDFVIDACSAGAQIMMHLSRLSEELVFWSNPLVGFIEIGDRFCTGSSIMPQKKNPDIPELARGKAGRVFGNLASALAVMKSQPLAYNKDNQESKQPLVDTLETVRSSVRVFSRLLPSLSVNQARMRAAASDGFSTATDLADYLVRRGLPFREAHEVVALTVRRCIESGKDLSQLTLEELRQFSPVIEADVFQSVTLEGSVLARNHVGGTAPAAVTSAIESARQRVAAA